jgi:hypothetical protein
MELRGCRKPRPTPRERSGNVLGPTPLCVCDSTGMECVESCVGCTADTASAGCCGRFWNKCQEKRFKLSNGEYISIGERSSHHLSMTSM